MKKKVNRRPSEEMAAEYDFSKGVRGKYAKRYAEGSNVIVLDPDVARQYPDASSVNELLRALARLAQSVRRKSK